MIRWALSTALLLLAACGAPLPSAVPVEVEDAIGSSPRALCAEGPVVEGIDVSRYQGDIEWTGVKQAGKAFAIIQAGRGLSKDPKFAFNFEQAKLHGIIRGAYLRFYPSQDVAGQAQILIDAAGKNQFTDLPPMLDVEDMDGLASDTVLDRLSDLIARVRAGTGRTPMIYTGYYFWRDNLKAIHFGAHPLLVANYTTLCPLVPDGWSRWHFLQYSSTGVVPGVTANTVDLDHFNGTLAELRGLVNGALERMGSLTGTVYGASPGEARPLGGVTVSVGTQRQLTGVDGRFFFTVAAGAHKVILNKTGFATASIEQVVNEGEGTQTQFTLGTGGTTPVNPNGPGLSGLVYGAMDNAPIHGASLELRDANGKVLGAGVTGPDGTFDLEVLRAPATGLLTVSQKGFNDRKVPTNVPVDRRIQLELGLDPLGAEDSGSWRVVATSATGCTATTGSELLALMALLPLLRRASRPRAR